MLEVKRKGKARASPDVESEDGSGSEDDEEDEDDDYDYEEEGERQADMDFGESPEEEQDELDEDDMEVDPPAVAAVRSRRVFFSSSHFLFKGSHNLRRARKPSGRAAAMQNAAAEEVPSRTPGPSKGRKRKLSSPQAHAGPKRRLQSHSKAATKDISDDEPIEGFADGLASLGYPRDFQVAVRSYVSTYFQTHKGIIYCSAFGASKRKPRLSKREITLSKREIALATTKRPTFGSAGLRWADPASNVGSINKDAPSCRSSPMANLTATLRGWTP